MESVVAGVVANLICGSTKKGIFLTKEYLVKEMAKLIKEDNRKLGFIAEEIVKLDKQEDLGDYNEQGVLKKMEKSPELVEALNSIRSEKVENTVIQTHHGSGDNVGGNKYC